MPIKAGKQNQEVRIFIDLLKLHRSGEIVPESPERERGADPVKSFLNRQRERERERERERGARKQAF
ncbi:hypothetical protein Hanom_Chr04g00350211 [Helianthus anomalus]